LQEKETAMNRFGWGALAVAAGMSQAVAQGPVQVGRFDQLELRGGGRVTVRHGAEQRVTMVRGDSAITGFRVEGDRLIITACVRSCNRYDLEVEVIVPSLEAAAVHGGGAIRVQGAFPQRGQVALAVNGGGLIDTRESDAASVVAAVNGGGQIRARARTSLVASVRGGGSISYWGNPEVVQSVRGGGSIRRGETG
jgi:hypothetical protein